MTAEQIPLIQKDMTVLTAKMEELSKEVKANFTEYREEAKLQQKHREESLRFHAEQRKESNDFHEKLIEKLEGKFAGKWTEKVLTFVGSGIGIALIGAIMALILIKY